MFRNLPNEVMGILDNIKAGLPILREIDGQILNLEGKARKSREQEFEESFDEERGDIAELHHEYGDCANWPVLHVDPWMSRPQRINRLADWHVRALDSIRYPMHSRDVGLIESGFATEVVSLDDCIRRNWLWHYGVRMRSDLRRLMRNGRIRYEQVSERRFCFDVRQIRNSDKA